MTKILSEFQKFAIKGNAIDLAVGVVIGTAFGRITNSLVSDIINPIIGFLFGNIDFSENVYVLRKATETTTEISLRYGSLVTVIINFILVSFALFLIIKYLHALQERFQSEDDLKKEQSTPRDITLLTEIRDELRKK
jgi:large conductance mechanosensitive channel